MNILNKGFQQFAENGNVTIYTKILTGKLTPLRERFICCWIDSVNKKTEYICYGFLYIEKGFKSYHINIEVYKPKNQTNIL